MPRQCPVSVVAHRLTHDRGSLHWCLWSVSGRGLSTSPLPRLVQTSPTSCSPSSSSSYCRLDGRHCYQHSALLAQWIQVCSVYSVNFGFCSHWCILMKPGVYWKWFGTRSLIRSGIVQGSFSAGFSVISACFLVIMTNNVIVRMKNNTRNTLCDYSFTLTPFIRGLLLWDIACFDNARFLRIWLILFLF